MKTSLLALLAVILSSAPAFARDSYWMVCNDGTIAANTFEYRNGADGRATDVTLLFGSWLLQGKLVNTNFGPITITGSGDQSDAVYSGQITMDYPTSSVFLRGELSLAGTTYKVDRQLKCKHNEGELK